MPGNDGMECPAFCPNKCGPEDMICPGGQDWNGCQMPDMCMPSKGKQYLNYNNCHGIYLISILFAYYRYIELKCVFIFYLMYFFL